MKEVIRHFYQKEVLDIRQVYSNISCITAKDGCFALKRTYDTKIEWVCHYIQSLHLDAFVPVILTIENHYYFQLGEFYYYLMPWLDFEGEMVQELRLRNYFRKICKLHNETFFVSKIQEGYFAKEIEAMRQELAERHQFYEMLMNCSEQSDYKAPWHWMMLQLYPSIIACFGRCEQLLSQYETCVKEKKTCRLCFTYNHYDLNHYCFANDLLISLEGCSFQRPTSDIYAVYSKLSDHYLDFENIETFYMKHFTFYDDEKLWLCANINMLPIFLVENDALEMCLSLEKVSRYLEIAENITKRLGFF